jgi:hypothetical protein
MGARRRRVEEFQAPKPQAEKCTTCARIVDGIESRVDPQIVKLWGKEQVVRMCPACYSMRARLW